jgi:hypothetical protein
MPENPKSAGLLKMMLIIFEENAGHFSCGRRPVP